MHFRAATQEDFSEIAMNTHCGQVMDAKGLVIADDKEGELQAGVIFDSFTMSSCQAHIYVYNKMALRHGLMYEVANYVFNTCGLQIMFGKVPEDNEKALKLNRHFGFTEVCRIPDACEIGVGYVILQMRVDDCKYLDKEVH